MKHEKLEKSNKPKHGGARPNSGRKPLLNKEDLAKVKTLIAQHGSEKDELTKRERILELLDILYKEGLKGNIPAIKEYLDRQLGKAKDRLDVTSNGDSLQPVLVKFINGENKDNRNTN